MQHAEVRVAQRGGDSAERRSGRDERFLGDGSRKLLRLLRRREDVFADVRPSLSRLYEELSNGACVLRGNERGLARESVTARREGGDGTNVSGRAWGNGMGERATGRPRRFQLGRGAQRIWRGTQANASQRTRRPLPSPSRPPRAW